MRFSVSVSVSGIISRRDGLRLYIACHTGRDERPVRANTPAVAAPRDEASPRILSPEGLTPEVRRFFEAGRASALHPQLTPVQSELVKEANTLGSAAHRLAAGMPAEEATVDDAFVAADDACPECGSPLDFEGVPPHPDRMVQPVCRTCRRTFAVRMTQ